MTRDFWKYLFFACKILLLIVATVFMFVIEKLESSGGGVFSQDDVKKLKIFAIVSEVLALLLILFPTVTWIYYYFSGKNV